MVASQIRVPESLHSYIREESEKTGMSQNAVMLMLMSLGKKVNEGCCTINIHDDNNRHCHHQNP